MPWLNKSISLASLNEHIFVVYITGLQFLFSRAFYACVHREKKKKASLRCLNTVSSTYIWMGRYNQSLSLDATIVVSKNCSIIGEHVLIIFLTL